MLLHSQSPLVIEQPSASADQRKGQNGLAPLPSESCPCPQWGPQSVMPLPLLEYVGIYIYIYICVWPAITFKPSDILSPPQIILRGSNVNICHSNFSYHSVSFYFFGFSIFFRAPSKNLGHGGPPPIEFLVFWLFFGPGGLGWGWVLFARLAG